MTLTLIPAGHESGKNRIRAQKGNAAAFRFRIRNAAVTLLVERHGWYGSS